MEYYLFAKFPSRKKMNHFVDTNKSILIDGKLIFDENKRVSFGERSCLWTYELESDAEVARQFLKGHVEQHMIVSDKTNYSIDGG